MKCLWEPIEAETTEHHVLHMVLYYPCLGHFLVIPRMVEIPRGGPATDASARGDVSQGRKTTDMAGTDRREEDDGGIATLHSTPEMESSAVAKFLPISCTWF